MNKVEEKKYFFRYIDCKNVIKFNRSCLRAQDLIQKQIHLKRIIGEKKHRIVRRGVGFFESVCKALGFLSLTKNKTEEEKEPDLEGVADLFEELEVPILIPI